jgi:hypothetical protein
MVAQIKTQVQEWTKTAGEAAGKAPEALAFSLTWLRVVVGGKTRCWADRGEAASFRANLATQSARDNLLARKAC